MVEGVGRHSGVDERQVEMSDLDERVGRRESGRGRPVPATDERFVPDAPADHPNDPDLPVTEPPQAIPPEPVRPAEPAPAATEPEKPVAPAAPTRKRKRGVVRPLLFLLLPVALVYGGYGYVVGGQIMSTDNAYVGARTLGLSTDVSGTVIAVEVHNNEVVKKGQVMFRLRPDSFQIALDGAKAQLGTVYNQVLTLEASYKQALATIEQAKADIPYYEVTLRRQQDLVKNAFASQAVRDTAQHDYTAAQQRLLVAQANAQSMLAQLGGNADQPIKQNPFYLQAQSAVDNAERDLRDTVVRAPYDGVVTNVDQLQVGGYLPAAQPGFTLVSNTDMWVDASPKETELTWVHPGQTVTVTVDMYPNDEWEGTVESISPASGASFSLLPAQNTTGNWVKVVQRIPMRVHLVLDPNKPPLRVGMSAIVEIDTGHVRGLPRSVTDFIKAHAPEPVRAFLKRIGIPHV